VVERVQIHLPVLEVVLLNEAGRLETAFDWVANGVIRTDGLVRRVPEPERLLRDRDAKAPLKVAQGLTGGVAQVVAAHRLHDHLDRIEGILCDLVDKGVATAGAAPALACLMAGRARAFFDHGFSAAVGAAGNGWVDWRWDVHGGRW
jgi:hypothetical protein